MSINKRNTLSEYFIKSNYSLFCFLLLFINLCIISDNRVFADDIYIKTDSSLESIDFFPKEYENQDIVKFSKCKVYKLNKEMVDYANDNKSKLERDIGNIYQMYRNLYYIEKDCPELAEKVNDLRKRADEIYGPAVIQYLSLVKDSEDYDKLSPGKIFEARDKDIIRLSERVKALKENLPYIFGGKYSYEKADTLLTSYLAQINLGGAEPPPDSVLVLHPNIVTCDKDYIVQKLYQGRYFKLSLEKFNINWNYKMPKHFKLKSSEIHEDEVFISFNTIVDGISGSFQVSPNYDDTSKYVPKTYLEKLSKDENYLNMLVGNSNFVVNSNVELFGKRPVLIVQHKKDQSASVATSVAYVFVAGKFIYEIKFSVNVGNEKESGEILKRNLPLFEKIVEANKVERAN